MLNLSTVLMSLYGTYAVGWAVNDLYQADRLEAWANWAGIGVGLLLVFAALVVRGKIPGGLPIAGAALLGLQALDVHNAAHLATPLPLQIIRAAVSLALVGTAFYGGLPSRQEPGERGRSPKEETASQPSAS